MILSIIELLMPTVREVLGRAIPDPEARAKAEAEMREALAKNQTAVLDAMSKVMSSDAASSAYVRNARPTIVYWSLALTTYIVVGAPLGWADEMVSALQAMPSELYTMMMVGIGAFGVTRGLEKTARAYRQKQ